MAVDIATLVEDPEFKSLSASDKRSLLSEGDPEFASLTDQEIEEFSSPAVAQQQAVVPLTEEQQSIDQFIRSSQAGPLSKAGSAIGGLFNTFIKEPVQSVGEATAQISEVLRRQPLSSSIPQLAQTGVEAGGRALFSLGDVINQLVNKSTAAASNAVDNPLQAAIKAAVGTVPAVNALTQLVPSAPSESEINQFLQDQQRAKSIEAVLSQPLVPELIGEADIPLAENLQTVAEVAPFVPPVLRGAGRAVTGGAKALTTGGRAIASPIQTGKELLSRVSPTLSERVAPVARLRDATISSLDLGADDLDLVLPKVPNAVERTLQTTGKIPETAEEAVSGMKGSRKRIYNERLEANNAAKEQGLKVDFERSLQDAEDAVNSKTNLSAEQKKAQIKELRDTYSGQKDPFEGQDVQEDLNQELSDAYSNQTIDKKSLVGKKAFRDSVARQMDDMGQAATGIADSSYSDIGDIIEVQGRLQRRINEIIVDRANATAPIKETPKGLPTTKVGVASRAGKAVLSPLRKTQMENLNKNVQRVFGEQPARPPVLPLEQTILNELRAAQTPSALASREAEIQALMQSYPRNIRSDPALARLVAEAELGSTAP